MTTLKLGSKGEQVKRLCQLLGVKEQEEYTKEVQSLVKKFQANQNLDADGICGTKTWITLLVYQRLKFNNLGEISEEDYIWAAEFLGCEVNALKALVAVETGGKSGFDKPGKPQILFEGHVFWKELNSKGINPTPLSEKYPSIVYKSWTTKYYLGGIKEWERFDIASILNEECAKLSTSYGLFQIMGNNYKSCGEKSIDKFYEGMCKSQLQQFIYGVMFLRSSGIYSHLAKKDWKEVARLYNGSGQVDTYSKKLEDAYNKLKK